MQNKAERGGKVAHFIFLDWSKAFDKIDNNMLLQTLNDLGVDKHLVKLCGEIYRIKKFFVDIENVQSTTHDQNTGIRQGCPLSPYLFVLVMDVIMKNIKSDPAYVNAENMGIPFAELLYADDTVIFSDNHKSLETTLHLLQREGRKFGLTLNLSKCVHISINESKDIKFDNLSTVPKDRNTIYLGADINNKTAPSEEISRRIRETTVVWKKMAKLWIRAKIPTHKKVQYYNAVVRAKLTYGLETLNMTLQQKARLRAFHAKGLRQILKKKHPYHCRHNTNERIFLAANNLVRIAERNKEYKRKNATKWFLKHPKKRKSQKSTK